MESVAKLRAQWASIKDFPSWEACLVLAILEGDHAFYQKVGRRLEDRGMVALLQPGLTCTSLNDYRLGYILGSTPPAIVSTAPGKNSAGARP